MSDVTSGTSSTGSDSSSGAPTVSANTPASTPTESKAETGAKGEVKAKSLKPGSKSPDLIAAYARLVVEARDRGYRDPLVDGCLDDGDKSARHLEQVAERMPVDAGELEALRTASQAFRRAFVDDLRSLKLGLQSVKGGKVFVATHGAADEVTCYRQLVAGMTPGHLGHNRPLLEATEASFAGYMHADGELQVLQAKARAQAARVAEAKKRLLLDLRSIRAAMDLAKARKEKEALTHARHAA